MEISAGLIYLIDLLSSIDFSLLLISIIGTVILITVILWQIDTNNYSVEEFYNSKLYKNTKKTLILILIALTITLFIPSKKTMVAMVVTPIITNNESIQNISDKSLKAIEKLLDEYIKEDTSENKE